MNSFLDLVKMNIKNKLDHLDYTKTYLIWDEPYFYEEISSEEKLVHNVEKMLAGESMQAFLKKGIYNLRLHAKGYKIYILPKIKKGEELTEFMQLLNMLDVYHYNTIHAGFRKMSITIKGDMFMRPNREYILSFVNLNEYVVHAYELDEEGRRIEDLFYVVNAV